MKSFGIKTSKKKKKISSSVFHKEEEKKQEETVFISGVFQEQKKSKTKHLVIPLKKREVISSESNEDLEAAEAILKDLKEKNENENEQEKIVIPLFNHKKNSDQSKKSMLLAHHVALQNAYKDDKERYAQELKNLPETPDFTSPDYNDVPVSAFGEAMLRGMGWDGESTKTTKPEVIKPRVFRLGLGATELPDSQKKRKKSKKHKSKREHRDEDEVKRKKRSRSRDKTPKRSRRR